MMDYYFSVLARTEYEERVKKVEMEIVARRRQPQRVGAFSQMLYGLGERLERTGARLKAQNQPMTMQQSYHGGRIG